MTPRTVEDDTSAMLRLLAQPAQVGEHISQQIDRAARRCRLSAVRVRKLWYGQAKVSGADLAAILRALGRSEDLLAAYMESQTQLLEARVHSLRDAAP